MTKTATTLLCLVGLALVPASFAQGPIDPLFKTLAPGLSVKSSTSATPDQTKAIGQKLGGDIERLSNSVLQIHGRAIKVNTILAADVKNAQAIEQALLKIKPFPFCLRNDRLVVEYVGNDIDSAIATKTAYELGLLPKPKSVRYRVRAELAAIDQADYMSCNPLFNHFLALHSNPSDEVRQKIGELAPKFTFGNHLVLRSPTLSPQPSVYQFQPSATDSKQLAGNVQYSFANLPKREGVPFVTATMEITVNDSGLLANTEKPAAALTSPTKFWPADDPRIKTLVNQITAGRETNHAKATAILEWLAPGKNIKYSGQTGSRWGGAKVFEQKFGHCWDFSDAFVTLCRAAEVPSRQVAGWFYGSAGHVWAEFFDPDKGWQQVDPTGGNILPCGIYHIPYFTTEDGEMPIVYLSMPKIEATP